ncbi:MAG: hypothetical protein IPK80_16395 [Nannocystis sp.]|jgi:hypothetical protein|nr:hypothetical protein [Nannocystis sp.]
MSRPLARALALALALAAADARAHHVPGHGASEGVRNINSLGSRGGRAESRLLLLNEFVYTSQGVNPSVTDTTSLYGEFAPIPALSLAVQAPFLVLRDLANEETRVGYGDTRLQLRVTPHARKLIHRVFTAGLTVSLPTRTVRLNVDPGPVTAVSPYVFFTRTYDRHFWQVMGLSVLERRRAGSAVDLSVGAQGGSRLLGGKFTLGLGALLDLRVLNTCAQPTGGAAVCAHSRPGEDDRPIGALRAIVLTTFSYHLTKRLTLLGAIQGPISPRLDFTVAGSLGAQVFF